MNNIYGRTAALLVSIPFLFAIASCFEDSVEPDTTPPTVKMTCPVAGDTVGSQTALSATVRDNSGIAYVRFYAEDRLIAEDSSEPYEQIWYSGFWEDDREYSIRVEAQDKSGNVASSEPVTVHLAEDTRFIPEMVKPEPEDLLTVSEVTYRWNPVPGARGYILRLRIPEIGVDQFMCDDAGHETCYLRVPDTEYTGCPPIHEGVSAEGIIDVTVDVKAYWDSYHSSEWSEEILFHIDPPEEPEEPPADILDILEGVRMKIRETYNGYLYTSVITEPTVTIQLETVHMYPYHNYFIEYDCSVEGDTIMIDLTGVGSPMVVSPAYGPATAAALIYPAPGQYTLIIRCHESRDSFSMQVTDSSVYYEQEVYEFVESETELLWRIKPNSFLFDGDAHEVRYEWMVNAFRDSLLAMGCFEEFVYPDGGILPHECDNCEFFYYDNETDFVAAGDMLELFMQDPQFSTGSFRIILWSWNNIIYNSYTFKPMQGADRNRRF